MRLCVLYGRHPGMPLARELRKANLRVEKLFLLLVKFNEKNVNTVKVVASDSRVT